MKLPEDFMARMQSMLGDEYADFVMAYENEADKALRLNTLKAGQEFLKKAHFSLRPVSWAADGYYYGTGDIPGRHPYHEAGVYYIQEPSAMAPAEYLNVSPGERVLDLCAAPGGKSTQIAAKMKGQGILICNEIHTARAKILSENVERMGISNAIVTNETPGKLAEVFVEYFDKILVDAPCSGEGMFRKNETALKEWSIENVKICASRQDEILSCAANMLRPGGKIVYSTCTFAPEENEGSISRFLKRFPEFEILSVKKEPKMTEGNPGWIEDAPEHISNTVRLFPHKLQGEGHYFALLQKKGENFKDTSIDTEIFLPEKSCREWLKFRQENLKASSSQDHFVPFDRWEEMSKGNYIAFGEQLYLLPHQAPSLKGLKVLRPGLHLGTNKKNRFVPSHALALFLNRAMVCRSMDFTASDQEIYSYINGETIAADGEKGWYLITTDGYSIGWGKLSGGIMKNHYPKGLRKLLQT